MSDASVIHISASQVILADSCLRKWAFKYIEKRKEPQSAAQADGEAAHARAELWLTTGQHPGDDAMGKLIQAAMRPGYLPTPSPDLLVEHEFSIPLLPQAVFVGFIDCVVPPANGHAIVIDHKFIANLTWAKTVAQLKGDVQAISYGKVALMRWPDLRSIERRWLYYQKKSTKTQAVAFVGTPLEVEEAWLGVQQRATNLARLRLAAPRVCDLEGNPDACSDYGGCAFRSFCNIGPATGKFIFTPSATNARLATPQGGGLTMALTLQQQLEALKALKAQATSQPTSQPTSPAPIAQAPAPVAQATTVTSQPIPQPVQDSLLAALQVAHGAKGVNPSNPSKVQAPAQAPTQAPTQAPAQAPAPAASLASMLAALPAKASAPQVEAAPAATIAQAPVATAVPGSPTEKSPATGPAEKPKKERKATTPKEVPTSAPSGQLSVVFGAAIVKWPMTNTAPVHLVDLLVPLMRKVADENKVAHWALVPFGQGKALLAHALDQYLTESNWKGTILVGESDEAWACHETLVAHADVIVRGTRI